MTPYWTFSGKQFRELCLRQKCDTKHQPCSFSYVHTPAKDPHVGCSLTATMISRDPLPTLRIPLVFLLLWVQLLAPPKAAYKPHGSCTTCRKNKQTNKPKTFPKARWLKGFVLWILCFVLVEMPGHHPKWRFLLRLTGVHLTLSRPSILLRNLVGM